MLCLWMLLFILISHHHQRPHALIPQSARLQEANNIDPEAARMHRLPQISPVPQSHLSLLRLLHNTVKH